MSAILALEKTKISKNNTLRQSQIKIVRIAASVFLPFIEILNIEGMTPISVYLLIN